MEDDVSDKLVEAIRDLVTTLQVTNLLLSAEQDRRRQEAERAERRRALDTLRATPDPVED